MSISDTALALGVAIPTLMLGGWSWSAHAAGLPAHQSNAADLQQKLDRLAVVGNVLYIAAHPDDENTQLLSYLVNGRLLHATYLSLTRGDGGQNLLGSEQGVLLGMIRTQELLAARRTDGAEQLFTRARDFGFSKNAEETLAIWGKEPVLRDVVWLIRRARPDVIFTRFSPSDTETHGHHTASARLALEAFKLAADPSYHPEDLVAGPWQPRRIYWNTYSFGPRGAEPAPAERAKLAALDVGGYSPLRGVSYGEMAADSRSMHKSQGFGAAKRRGTQVEYFSPLDGKPATASPFDGIDLSWHRVPGGDQVAPLVEKARREFSPAHPEASLPALWAIEAAMQKLPDHPWKAQKLEEVHSLLVGCAGLYLDAAASDVVAVPGAPISWTASALNRSVAAITLESARLVDGNSRPLDSAPPNQAIGEKLTEEKPWKRDFSTPLPDDTALSDPYWLAAPPSPGLFNVPNLHDVGPPEGRGLEAELVVRFGSGSDAHQLAVRRPLLYRWVDPTAGERTRAVEVSPPVTATAAAANVMFADSATQTITVVLKANVDHPQGQLSAAAGAGWTVTVDGALKLAKKGDEQTVLLHVTPPKAAAAPASETTLALSVKIGDRSWNRAVRHVDYGHIPAQVLFPLANLRLCRFDLGRGPREIGYIPGSGDEVPAALEQVGYHVTRLDDAALTDGKLERFAAIVVGVRAFNTNARLPFHHERLMQYVKNGGVLVAQYNTRNWLSSVPADLGPFPLTISSDRVTDENAVVGLALPQHAVLNHPNKITAADFTGWVQERGLYFAQPFDARYEAPLSMHDPGEPERKGSLLVAKLGRGRFVYTGLAFFRQLPAGVPGAFRLFANLLAPDHGH